MRKELLEGLSIGIAIGLAVVAIRLLLDDVSAAQGLVLIVVGLVFCGLQLLLSLRRARRAQPPATNSSPTPAPQRRPHRNNPFDQELTRNWTGLNDQPIEENGTANQPTEDHPEQRS